MKQLSLLIGLFLALIGALHAETAPIDQAAADLLFHQLVDAQIGRNYEAFLSKGTDELKAALSQTQFEAACNVIDPKLADGFDITALGELHQHGIEVFLYRLTPKNGGDDILGTMSVRQGQVAGIYFR